MVPIPFASFSALAAVLSSLPLCHSAAITRRATPYRLLREYSGADFFTGFQPFTALDPTNGHVKYVSYETAASSSLLGFVHDATTNSSLAYMGVDGINLAPNGRNSIRLESTENIAINSIVVADIARMPTGCGLWSAFWLLGGQDWPASGEIDIVESVHNSDHDTVTLHTSPGCTVDSSPATLFQGKLSTGNCNANTAFDGCSVVNDPTIMASTGNAQFARRLATAGKAFNEQGGGVYVTVWTAQGILVYLIPRDSLPSDLASDRPDPSSWVFAPLVKFTGSGCDFTKFFRNMRIVINTDFCGSWAGQPAIWESSGCRASTQTATCNEYVANHPEAFRENSSWLFRSIKVYSA